MGVGGGLFRSGFRRSFRLRRGFFCRSFCLRRGFFRRSFGLRRGFFRRGFCLRRGLFRRSFCFRRGLFRRGFRLRRGLFRRGFCLRRGLFRRSFCLRRGFFRRRRYFRLFGGGFRFFARGALICPSFLFLLAVFEFELHTAPLRFKQMMMRALFRLFANNARLRFDFVGDWERGRKIWDDGKVIDRFPILRERNGRLLFTSKRDKTCKKAYAKR